MKRQTSRGQALESPLARYGAALAVGLLAVILGVVLPSHWNLKLPFITFYTVLITIAAWNGGLFPGLLATALCTIAAALWLEPQNSLAVEPGAEGALRSRSRAPGALQPGRQRPQAHARRRADHPAGGAAPALRPGERARHGPRLPAAELPCIFDRHVAARRRTGGGAGLGLHIVKSIVEAHGGVLGADSHEALGSTFWFTLPIAGEGAGGRLKEVGI
jgi:Histidine kinase-, DNA gyrase B-, and HSP90-like ATPase